MSSDENGNANDMNVAIKQFIPVLILFIIGTVVGFIITDNNGNGSLGSRIGISLVLGWGIGGSVLGWYKTRSMFPPKPIVQQKPNTPQSNMLDHKAFFPAARSVIRVVCSVVVGFVLMPVEFIKFIVAIVKSKKGSNTASNNASTT